MARVQRLLRRDSSRCGMTRLEERRSPDTHVLKLGSLKFLAFLVRFYQEEVELGKHDFVAISMAKDRVGLGVRRKGWGNQ